jgi:hypothetical protein
MLTTTRIPVAPGIVPLDLLERQIDAYIASTQGSR